MFKNEYQGGPTVEVFTTQGKDPLNKWKISGALKRIYERDVKSFVYHLEGSTATSKLQLPKDNTKRSLHLIQRYLTMQVFVPSTKDFSIELSMTDTGNSKRRLVMSTSIKDFSITPLHAKLNLSIIKRNSWLNLCLDLSSLLSDLFYKQTFKSLDSIILSGNCKIRRIFTMRNQPPDTTDSEFKLNVLNGENIGESLEQLQLENIPPNMQFASTVPYVTQVINVGKIRSFLNLHSASQSSVHSDVGSSLQSQTLSARDQRQVPSHIAFGTRVRLDSTGSTRSASNKSSRSASNTSILERKEISNISLQTNKSSVEVEARLYSKSAPQPEKRSNAKFLTPRNSRVIDGSVAVPSPPSSPQPRKIQAKPRIRRVKSPNVRVSTLSSDSISSTNYSESNGDRTDNNQDKSEVFMFHSRPHLVHRRGNDIVSESLNEVTNIISNTPEEDDFVKSESSDSDDDITQIIRHTPPIPLQKNIGVRSHSKLLYNSTKYSNHSPANSQDFNSLRASRLRKDPLSVDSRSSLNRSIQSLRSSDITLTGSVDTLVHNSISKEDSLAGEPPVSEFSPLRRLDDLNATDVSAYFGNTSHRSVTVSRKSLREIPQKSSRSGAEISPLFGNTIPETSSFQVGSWSESFEAQMLESMKREHEEEMLREEQDAHVKNESGLEGSGQHGKGRHGHLMYEDDGSGDESFDTSWSTWKQPPMMHSMTYKKEMEGGVPVSKDLDTSLTSLNQSNPRDWGKLFSPPIVLPSERAKQEKEVLSDVESGGSMPDVFGMSDGSTVSGRTSSLQESDDEEMLDLMYDPCLNCYFDPKTGRYYELKG